MFNIQYWVLNSEVLSINRVLFFPCFFVVSFDWKLDILGRTVLFMPEIGHASSFVSPLVWGVEIISQELSWVCVLLLLWLPSVHLQDRFQILPPYLVLRLRLVCWRLFLNDSSILSFRSSPCAHPSESEHLHAIAFPSAVTCSSVRASLMVGLGSWVLQFNFSHRGCVSES